MFLLTKRQTRAAMAAAAGAAAYLAASEIGAKKIKTGGLFVLSTMAMAGVMTAKSSAKAQAVENRLNHFIGSGGSIGGPLTVQGTVNAANTFQIGSNPLSLPRNHRADLNWTPNTHQGSSPASYSQSFTDNTVSRVNDLIDQVSAVSNRADYLNDELVTAGVLT